MTSKHDNDVMTMMMMVDDNNPDVIGLFVSDIKLAHSHI